MAGPDDRGELLIYRTPDGEVLLDVRLARESVWLSLNQLSELFGRDKSVISKHLRNVFQEEELVREATIARFAAVRREGSRSVQRPIDYYNLDAIISVGYRVNSRQGTHFRIWATRVLREHLLVGYTVNQVRLRELNQSIRLIAETAKRRDLSGDEARALLAVVGDYSRALELLDDYDHQRVKPPATAGALVRSLDYEEALRIIAQLRTKFGESPLFGAEKDKGLASALGAIMQTFDGRDVYPSLEEKAANLLYFLVKNHAFIDGNKRIAAALFLWFLARNNALDFTRFSDGTLVAVTIMIAESMPGERTVLTRIVMHLLSHGGEP